MSVDDRFLELLHRVRCGDADAASELVDEYSLAIRIAVRTRLSDPALRRQFDSMDVCQSVLGSFFLRMATGMYQIEQPAQLVALLMAIARKKLAMRVRRELQQCRNARRGISLNAAAHQPSARGPDPAQAVMHAELVDQAYALMDADTREVAHRRTDDATWPEIAAAMGGTAEGRRKQYQRALQRIAVALNVDEPS
jgi:RNA polymerase sigma-70 factor (ECF subfamily)